MEVMSLKYFIPHHLLKPFIIRLWVFESKSGIPVNDLKLIAPNGKIRLVVSYKNALWGTIEKYTKLMTESSPMIVGQVTKPIIINSDVAQGTIGVEFKPFAAYRFFKCPLPEVTNKICQVYEVMDETGCDLRQRISEVSTVEDKISFLEDFLLRRFYASPVIDTSVIERVVRKIVATNGLISITELCRDIGYSKRHLDRRFAEYIGITPKMFACIIRFQCLYKKLYLKNANIIRQELYELYYDQSHFMRDFKRFTGYMPGDFLKQQNNFGKLFLSDLI